MDPPRLLSLFVLLVLLSNSGTFSLFPPFDKVQRCQDAHIWPLNGRPLVRDYRGRVLLLVFVSLEQSPRDEQQCKRELNRLDTLSEHFADVRVLAVAPREEDAGKVRAFAWQFPRIRFEQATAEAPIWSLFDAKHLDTAIFDRCSRLTAWVPSGSDFAVTLSAVQTTISSSPCGHCDFDSGQKRILWPSFHPPVPQQPTSSKVFVNIDGMFAGPASSLRRWNSPSPPIFQRGDTKTAKRLHWTVDKEKKKADVRNKQLQQMNISTVGRAPSNANSPWQPAATATEEGERERDGEREGEREERERGREGMKGRTEPRPHWTLQQQQQHQQEQQRRGTDELLRQRTEGFPVAGGVRQSKDDRIGMRDSVGHQPSMGPQHRRRHQAAPKHQQIMAATTTGPEPAPLYPEGSEDAAGYDYYGDEYAAEWTTEAPEAAMQIPKPTGPVMPTNPTTQADKNFGFDLPCTGFSDESCFQQQTQLRPNEMHRCCRGRILFTDQCVAGKCSNATVQLCCIQRFLQAKLSCCSDERQADVDVGDHFSHCCFENFVDGEDPCCPRAYAAEQWRSVHELCLPNVEMDLTGVKVPSPLVGTTLITEFDFSKTDRWRFECRYGSHVQQYSFFEASRMDQRISTTTGNSSSRPKQQQNPAYFVVSPVGNAALPPPLLSDCNRGSGCAAWWGRFQLIYPDSQQPVPLSHYVHGPPAPIVLPMQHSKYTSTQPKALPKTSHHQPSNKRPADPLVNEKYKTMLCKSYTISGYCAYGAQCLFAHGDRELRPCPGRQRRVF
ncbi:hypothetical protein GPALN_012998 [Globodera pallida]|nr:hypothetical protein GPALN_012998 [Globodera pallida]